MHEELVRVTSTITEQAPTQHFMVPAAQGTTVLTSVPLLLQSTSVGPPILVQSTSVGAPMLVQGTVYAPRPYIGLGKNYKKGGYSQKKGGWC